jgi:hypothetical protein
MALVVGRYEALFALEGKQTFISPYNKDHKCIELLYTTIL